MELVRFEMRIPKQWRDTIRMETARQQVNGRKVGGRVSGQYLLPLTALHHFLSLSDKEREEAYQATTKFLEQEES
jgi:hypothetical protein